MNSEVNDSTPTSANLEAAEAGDFRKRKRNVLILLVMAESLLIAASSIASLYAPEFSFIPILAVGLAWGIGVFAWCKIDAEERGEQLRSSQKTVLVLLSGFGLIHYLLATRGVKRGLISLGWALLFWIGTSVITFIINVVLLAVILLIVGDPAPTN